MPAEQLSQDDSLLAICCLYVRPAEGGRASIFLLYLELFLLFETLTMMRVVCSL